MQRVDVRRWWHASSSFDDNTLPSIDISPSSQLLLNCPMHRSCLIPVICALHSDAPPSAVDAALPYELRAVEAALSAAARLLEAETSALEARALPSLHSLTQKVGQQGVPTPASHGYQRAVGRTSKTRYMKRSKLLAVPDVFINWVLFRVAERA